MGYICDRTHQHHLEIHEKEYRLADNDKSGRKNKTLKQQITGETSAKTFDDGNEDICKKHEENKKINQDHLAISSSSSSVDDNLVVVGEKDPDLDYNFYKYRKEKKVNNGRCSSSTSRNDTEYDHYRNNKTIKSTLRPKSISLETIVGYANIFLLKLAKLAQQFVIVSKRSKTRTTKKLCTTQNTTLTHKIKTAVNKSNVNSGSDNTSKSQSRKNIKINPQVTTITPIRVSASSTSSTSSSSSSSSLSKKEICFVDKGNHASAAPGVEGGIVGNCSTARKTTTTTSSSHNNRSSCGLVKHSLCLYAASSIIIALCYLTTPIVAYDAVHPIFAEGKSDKEILDHLLKNTRYDKRLLPPVDGTLTVNVSVLLLSLASPDESSLKYEVEFLLQQQWYDPRLRYANQSQYEYLNAIHHHEDIWLPDTYFIMHGDFKDPIIPMHFALRIYRNGTINYLMRRHLILSCQGRLNIFPFDDPLCSFALESISYEQSAITYVWKNDEDTLRKSPSLTTLNAYLIQNQTIACPIKASWRGNYSCLKVDLIFTRDRAFYFTTVFIPGIILVTSSFITFWLEWNAVPARSMIGNYSCLKVDLKFTRDRAFYFTTVFIPGIILVTSSFITFWLEWNAVPARVMIGVTTMLNFFTTSNGFRSTLPVVSNLTAMNVWDGVCMCFIYASLLEFVCVNYVGRKRPLHNVVYRPGENPVTQRLPAVLSRIGVILASPLNNPDFVYATNKEVIEQEFHAAISAEKPGAAIPPGTTVTTTPTGVLPVSGSLKSPLSRTPVSDDAEIGGGGDGGVGGLVTMPLMPTTLDDQMKARSRKNPIQSKRVGELNEVDIIETCFGPGETTSKKRESGGPNEIVACTSCGGSASPCTHSANNGCATETCFVQVRKKEPPHPIRVAKTIDVIARITFPTAYAVFLIFFFIHYKGFS